MPTDIDSDIMEDKVQNSDDYWVIDFWAEWCGPCKKLAPVFEEVSEEMESVQFGKVDMEEHDDIGGQFGVRALPTILILKDGEEIARTSGAMPKKKLKSWVEENTA
jgi:thioredoxin 1